MAIDLEDLKKRLRAPKPAKVRTDDLSTGSTMLNLALTGNPFFGLSRGRYYLMVGGSRSGKTFLGLQILAEASISKHFKSHSLVYHAPERGANMDITKFFGPALAKRMETTSPKTLEEFYKDAAKRFKDGPCVQLLDSMDALIPEAELKRFNKKPKAGEEKKGSYGLDKAKINSSHIRILHNELEKHGSILVIISQSRMNIGFGSQFNPETRSGGTALRFYAHSEIWFKVKESLKRNVRGKPRKIGTVMQASIKKNRDTGREPSVKLHHYPSLGFDDLGSVCAFLVEEGKWKEIEASEKMIQRIQDEGREEHVRREAMELWQEIEKSCEVERKNRYG